MVSLPFRTARVWPLMTLRWSNYWDVALSESCAKSDAGVTAKYMQSNPFHCRRKSSRTRSTLKVIFKRWRSCQTWSTRTSFVWLRPLQDWTSASSTSTPKATRRVSNQDTVWISILPWCSKMEVAGKTSTKHTSPTWFHSRTTSAILNTNGMITHPVMTTTRYKLRALAHPHSLSKTTPLPGCFPREQTSLPTASTKWTQKTMTAFRHRKKSSLNRPDLPRVPTMAKAWQLLSEGTTPIDMGLCMLVRKKAII